MLEVPWGSKDYPLNTTKTKENITEDMDAEEFQKPWGKHKTNKKLAQTHTMVPTQRKNNFVNLQVDSKRRPVKSQAQQWKN